MRSGASYGHVIGRTGRISCGGVIGCRLKLVAFAREVGAIGQQGTGVAVVSKVDRDGRVELAVDGVGPAHLHVCLDEERANRYE
jgi:hypothetical protein